MDDRKRVEELSRVVADLSARVQRLESLLPDRPLPPLEAAASEPAHAQPAPSTRLSWSAAQAVMLRWAVVSVLLAVALILRTLTESGILGGAAGSAAGVSYAAALAAAGCYLTVRQRALGRLVLASGGFLVALVVVETHLRFGTTPAWLGYLVLGANAVNAAWASRRGHAPWVSPGVMAATLVTGLMLGLPRPHLTAVALFLGWVYLAARLGRGRGHSLLRWLVTALTFAWWGLWVLAARGLVSLPGAAAAEFLAAMLITMLIHLADVAGSAWRKAGAPLGPAEAALPFFSAILAFGAARLGTAGLGGGALLVAWLGLGTAAGTMITAQAWAARGFRGTAPFAAAAVGLGFVCLPPITGSVLALPLLAGGAFWVGLLSRALENGALRVVGYAGQAAVPLVAAAAGGLAGTSDDLWTSVSGLLAAGTIALAHHAWARARRPPSGSGFFAEIDPSDDSAVVVLLAALACWFLGANVTARAWLLGLPGDPSDRLLCAQSVILNASAVALFVTAVLNRNSELRGVGLLVTGVAGLKVFAYDLFAADGVALVVAVLTFAAALALGAVVLARWPQTEGEAPSAAAHPHAPGRSGRDPDPP